MNKGLKPILFTAVILAVLGSANAQEAKPATPAPAPAAAAPAVKTPAPAAQAPAAAPSVPAPAATAPAVKTPAPAAPAPAAQAPAAAPSVPAPAAAAPAVKTPAPAVPAPAPAAHAPAATTPAVPVHAPAAAASTAPAPAEQAPIAEKTSAADSAAVAPKADSVIALVVEEPKKKKSRKTRAQKNDLTIVDIPANFEIEARKIMPVDSKLGDDNLDTWWGRANLMLLTESDNFIGKIHLRMYPGTFYGNPTVAKPENGGFEYEYRDVLELHEAWAWHRGDYVNVKVGRWDNTTRFGSQTFGGYVDARRDQNFEKDRTDINEKRLENRNVRARGFMSTYDPENALQFGFNNFSENVSFDVALVSNDRHLNNGDLRVYFSFKELASIERMNIGIGYRSNIFDEIYNARGDVTHTISAGFSAPVINDIGILKGLTLFAEAAMIGLDDQDGQEEQLGSDYRYDKGKMNDIILPILFGLDIELYEGLDKIVIEAEYDGDRLNPEGTKAHRKSLQGSLYLQKVLNDRFTLNMGVQSENNTKDFSFAGRLQGRIN